MRWRATARARSATCSVWARISGTAVISHNAPRVSGPTAKGWRQGRPRIYGQGAGRAQGRDRGRHRRRHAMAVDCQSAPEWDPGSACNRDPSDGWL